MANVLPIVSYKVFPAHMGGQKGIVAFYEHLAEHHAVFMAVSFDNELEEASLPAEKLLYQHRKMPLNFFQLFRLQRKIKRERIDCLIAEHSYTGLLALLLRKLTGKPFIIHSHNIEAYRFQQMGRRSWKQYLRYEGWIHRKADFSFFKTAEELQTAIHQFSLSPSRCAVVPYGINDFRKEEGAAERVKSMYGLKSRYLLYFNGTLDYKPNTDAMEKLLQVVCPLLNAKGFDYTLLISGKWLPPHLQQKIEETDCIRFLGFVPDVVLLYQGCHLFLNPVQNDTGVKTKVVEALGNHCTVVSTESGASGIQKEFAGPKLHIAEDGNWEEFADLIIQLAGLPHDQTPAAFFEVFSWTAIAKHAAQKINNLRAQK